MWIDIIKFTPLPMGLMKDNKIWKRKIKQINYDERVIIEHYYKQKKSYSYIAKQIWKNRKSVEREIKRNGYYNWWWYWVYKAKIAQEKTERRKIKANRKHKKIYTWEWRTFVEKIKKKMKENWWSIDATIWRLKIEWKKVIVSTSTLYRYARNEDKELEKLLLYKSWWYKKWEYKYWKNSKILELESIEGREEIINNRERVWDYEIDLIVSKKSKAVLLNVIERKSRKITIRKLKNKEKLTVKKALKKIFGWEKVYSITTDNWPEFTDLIDICNELWIKWYRCHPYSSWEKWSVEVHNRYIRRYIPKWANINDYTDEKIEKIENKINNLPRKILWYKTPNEVYSMSIK